MKQSSIEWLFEQIDDAYIHQIYSKEFDQAKEMHKQEVIDAYKTFLDTTLPNEVYEEFYNDKFKTESNGK